MTSGDKAPNLLIVSDLHLGEDIRPANRTSVLRHLVILERELQAFLDHYARRRLDGRPWRLIVNGDMVDFLAVCLLPGEPGAAMGLDAELPAASDAEEHRYGLGTKPGAARAKMERVLARHVGVFQAMARFLGAGNTLGIVPGNHDMEFHWPVVQAAFRHGVAALWSQEPAAGRPGALSRQQIEEAISFHPWFYFEENVVWVEHGHQYDDYCSFEYILNPVEPTRDEIVLNVGAAGLHYVVNHADGNGGVQQEDWSCLGYLRWTWHQGSRGVMRIVRAYAAMAIRLLTSWRLMGRRPEAGGENRRRAHLERLRLLADQFKLREDTLVALDALRQRPVVTNLAKLVLALFLDRLILGVLATLAVLTSVLALPWSWAFAAVGTVIGGAWAGGRWLARARAPIDPIVKLNAMPDLIRGLVGAPFVVFGHAHEPVATPLRGGGWYFNTGTWVATERPGLLRSFTHLLIRKSEGGPRALLCQWRDGHSQAFAP